ncbi:Plasmodium exported protein, unknown function [Plasmodium malariae]|uniref:Fam-m protein n=1 Tax=Plasmodium malariae TaxID=5858 RepID=A0A1D3JHE4_PLAMA|nr:Plasmodium exported protein, unknown function [Plasmodium malariae]SBT85649.1 Plasmodium exported protein, unknown function [Plasmodium malariae]
MDHKIKSPFIFKIAIFIVLTWICYFYNDLTTFNKYIGIYTLDRKLYIRYNRILGKYEKEKVSNIVGMNELIHKYEQKNDKYGNRKKGQSNMCSLYKEEFNKQLKGHKYLVFEGKKLSHFERTLFKHLDYIDFIRKNPTISDKSYRNIIFKEYALLIYLPFLLLSWGYILPIIKYSVKKPEVSDFHFILFCVPVAILFTIFMLGVAYTLIKIKKHKRFVKKQ